MTTGETLHRDQRNGLTYTQMMHKYGLTRGQVAGRLRDYRKRDRGKVKVINFPTPIAQKAKPVDWDMWQDCIRGWTRDGWLTVAHDCDTHFPDHDENALNMRYRLYARKQPDLIVVGSDCADFSVMSSFDGDPDTDELVDDALYQFREYWKPHIDNLNRLCPRAIKVFIFGNHEQRILSYLYRNAPKLRRTVEDAWLQTVRYGGVLYIGHTEEIELGHLLIKHGNRSNEHAAKSLLDDESYQVNVMAGHIHRLTYYDREGRKYTVRGVTSGCAQRLRPEYVRTKGRSMTRKWQHGVAFATTNLKGTETFFDNVRFSQLGANMVAYLDGTVLEQAV